MEEYEEEERGPTQSEQFKIAEEYGSAVVPNEFPKTLVIAISTHGTIRSDKPEKFTVPQGITLVKVNAVIPSVCNIITSSDMKNVSDFITKEIVGKTPVLNREELKALASKITKDIIGKVKDSVDLTDAYVRQQRKAGESEPLTDELAFLNSFDRGYRVIDVTEQQMINKHYSRKNSAALNPTGDWQIKALNVEGQPDLINEVERANGERSTRLKDPEITFKELINFCIEKGAESFLIFDFSCANVTDENHDEVFSTDRDRRHYAYTMIKKGVLYGGKTKRTTRKSKKTRATKKSKKLRSRKITRRHKRKLK